MLCVIGIGGLRRSGKDTFARTLREVAAERGFAFATIAFADALRQAAAAAYGVDVSIFTDDAKKDTVCPEWSITYRQMLLNLGVPATLLGGDYDHWVKRWRIEVEQTQACLVAEASDIGRHMAATYRDRLVIAVPDVRRLNEAAAIHDAGGVNVLVQRPGVEWNGHITEMLADVSEIHGQRSYEELSLFSELKQGTWHPTDLERKVFDVSICNDGDVAALRPHADRARERWPRYPPSALASFHLAACSQPGPERSEVDAKVK